MAHGQPDFGQFSQKETVFALSDMAELAARLKSIDTFDRRGDVVWLDDFEDNLEKWFQFTLGTGASIALSTESARNGAKSCKLTTGNAVNDYTYINKTLPLPVSSKVGFEISFTSDEDLNGIFLYITYYDGAFYHQGVILYCPDTDVLYYYDENGSVQTIATSLNLRGAVTHYHTIKLVIDLVTGKYVRLILNEHTFDLSAYNLQKAVSTLAPFIFCRFVVRTGVASNQSIYADDAIITQNEP